MKANILLPNKDSYTKTRIQYEKKLYREFPLVAAALHRISTELLIESLEEPKESKKRTNTFFQIPAFKSFLSAQVTPALALNNLSLHEAELCLPNLLNQ